MTSVLCGNSCVNLEDASAYYYSDIERKLTFQMKCGLTVTMKCGSQNQYSALLRLVEGYFEPTEINAQGELIDHS